MTSRSMPSAFLKSILQNGIGRYVCQLQRITFLFSKSSGLSRGVRDFIENDLVDFARKNPGVVVYVKPDPNHKSPLVVAEYLNGNKKDIECQSMNREQVQKEVELARTQSGLDVVRLRKWMHTDNPTIQGLWTPFTNKPTYLNVETFPSKNPTWKYAERRPTLKLDNEISADKKLS
ncbi:large ribosomal subunit protein mL43-like [Saccoglossus kowalevskii]|uniref:Large ribosomal subunit protein mL43 n=1 Tax=Saccoglossus kowalevskii TaxID=10224 RepID=A0ABM0H1J6_SACKO|nr:PREDICTED: 39S ribosomal protein L43, mitochondrial-like [Saccoglossus kowalevskii]